MTAQITHINTRRYWQINHNGETLFTGTFMECWDQLVHEFGNMTLSSIAEAGICIKRLK